MTLREEFEKEVRNKVYSDIEFLFEASSSEYIKWLENKVNLTEDVSFRMVKITDRLPDLGERILFLDEGYKGKFMAEYLPNEEIPLKKGKFIEIKDCKIATDYLLNNYTHWLEKIN